MKAYVLKAVNDLRYEDIPLPTLQPGWVLVRVRAAGICSSDVARIYLNGTYHFPTIPGHEFCGEVVQTYDKKDEWLIGKRVGVFPLIPCKECEYCKVGHYEMCKNYNYLGSRCDGGFAEYVAVPSWNLIELPDNVSFTQASILEPFAVAFHAVSAIDLKQVKNAAVIGTGAIGLLAAMILQSKGIDVTIIGRNNTKKILADRCKIKNYIDLSSQRTEKQFDVVMEAVGSNESLKTSIEMTKSGGQIILIGNPYSDMTLEKKLYWQILRRQLKMIGTWNSMYEKDADSDWSKALNLIAAGLIDPCCVITHSFHQNELKKGLEVMKNHAEPYGRIVVRFNEQK